MLKTISLSQLQIGMYVERVVRQSGNVTIKSRGLVKTQRLLDVLKNKPIHEIEINLEKSDAKFASMFQDSQQNSPAEQVDQSVFEDSMDSQESLIDDPSSLVKPIQAPIQHKELQSESMQKATAVYNQAKSVQQDFIKKLRSGANPDFNQINNLSQDIIDSVFESSESMACLIMLKDADDYLVEHALNCAVLLAMFARFKQLSQAEIEDLTQAGLLMDIGMASLPSDLLQKEENLTEADWVVVRSHVDIGVELLERYADAPPIVYDVVQNHHERADGSGYPKGKTSDEISVYAQMAAIVDSYDAMISNRAYEHSDNATNALKKMFDDPSLDRQLVVDFTNAIGLHPVGSLVRLSNDHLAMISKRNANEPLKPVVMAFYNIAGNVATSIDRIDLALTDVSIVSGIRPEEFSINLPKFFKRAFST